MGTPAFAAVILESLIREGTHEISAVVTMPDKPMGRGLKMNPSEVKKVAEKYNLPILQPEKLRDENFLHQLSAFHADLFLVIAFRMLPEVIWQMPPKGCVNLHASLLPRYRGAAPINRAIMNGETMTGVTTFFINEKIDEGNIILSRSVPISASENAGELHDALLEISVPAVLETLKQIEESTYVLKSQEYSDKMPEAPKIFKNDCRIHWNQPAEQIYNQIRGLAPYPGAFTYVKMPDGEEVLLKIFQSQIVPNNRFLSPGSIYTDNKRLFVVAASDACLQVESLQLFGKKRMSVKDFLSGHKMFGNSHCIL